MRDGGIEPKIVPGCGIEKAFVGPSSRLVMRSVL